MKYWLVNILFCLVFDSLASEDILGCGGFIKSHINMDFSKVEIKLFTKQGSLREKTDCAPNGYYFLPLYDQGEYVLKIYPPPGWSFEPKEVSLNVNGKTDLCSLGKDINFIFKGFGITGQVETLGSPKGPVGVKLELIKDGGKETRETFSNEVGSFYFTPVFPGKYTVIAKHPRWSFSKSEVSVVVASGNTDLPPGSLMVDGFDVQGTVLTTDTMIENIYIGIYSSNKNIPGQSVQGCIKETIPNLVQHKTSLTYLCYVKSEVDGKFNIKALPPGTYELVPYYNSASNKVLYTFSPVSQKIIITQSSAVVPIPFEIIGVTVSGKILTAPKGKEVKNCDVIIDDKHVTLTNDQGVYILKDFKPGFYEVKLKADDMKFNARKIQVSLTNPMLPDIFADEFKVCGQVVSNEIHSIAIKKINNANKPIIQTTNANGEWCQYLSPGKYQVEVIVDDIQKSGGLQFFPVTQTIEVIESPISDIVFSQLKAKVLGSIECLRGSSPDCKTQSVTLKMLSNDGDYSGSNVEVTAKDGRYIFENVLPGTYEVELSPGILCFDKLMHQITVTKEKHEVPPFKHIGYSVLFDNSHKTKMVYSNNHIRETVILNAGESKICVKEQGKYTMDFDSCHTYSKSSEVLSFDTKDFPKAVKISPLTHANGIRISSPIKVNDLHILIKVDSDVEQKVPLTDANLETSDNNYVYLYILQVKADSFVQIQPLSEKLLFEPQKVDFVGGHDCKDQATEIIIARTGKVIEGFVQPAIEGVQITIEAPGLHLVTQTDKAGHYKAGPIDGSIAYKLSAEKDSFVFQETEGNFKAHKLCDITVSVLDAATGKSLQGVLLSLSGGSEGYRKNLLSNQDGSAIFGSLTPSEYYLRTVMKEYMFELASTRIVVKEGESVKINISGKRTAFSAFGIVSSLNGEPTPNIEVEAIGQANCSQYSEEAITESSGAFRIRGLQPKCYYLVRVKSGNGFNRHIDRWTPRDIEVQVNDKDIEGLKIIVFHPITHMDVTTHIVANNIEHYKSLRVKLFRENSFDSPLHSVKLENPGFRKGLNPGVRVMFPRIPVDGKNYYVQLETSLSPSQFKYDIPTVQFSATGSFKHVQLNFNATTKASEQDLNQTSMLALPMIIMISLIFFNQQKVSEVLHVVSDKLSSVQLKGNTNQFTQPQQSTLVDHREIEQIVQNINAVKKKPKPKKI